MFEHTNGLVKSLYNWEVRNLLHLNQLWTFKQVLWMYIVFCGMENKCIISTNEQRFASSLEYIVVCD